MKSVAISLFCVVVFCCQVSAKRPKVGECVSKCRRVKDGDYQSCLGCEVYVSCSNGRLYDNRPCPASLVWDDSVKMCQWSSSTCSDEVVVENPCGNDCADLPDGDYQSCNGCHVYLTCSNNLTHDDRPCPEDLVWDDNSKQCMATSTTCIDVNDAKSNG